MIHRTVLVTVAMMTFSISIRADNWPTHKADIQRTSTSTEELAFPLQLTWTRKTSSPPAPAWPQKIGSAQSAKWAKRKGLYADRIDFDLSFDLISAEGKVFYGSSSDDKLYCLDAHTGKEMWSYFTNGPIRLAPSYSEGKVYVGSDDGYAYCLDAKDGKLNWRFTAVSKERKIPGNGRVISNWPIRSSIVVHEDKAMFTSGIFPKQGVYWVAVNKDTGTKISLRNLTFSAQGYIFLQGNKFTMPTGRSKPRGIQGTIELRKRRSAFVEPKLKGFPYSLIKAGSHYLAGGDGKVGAFLVSHGKEVWTAKIEGSALCLAVSNGKLLVSTDKGAIYCFSDSIRGLTSTASSIQPKTTVSKPNHKKAAETILDKINFNKGYCLVLGTDGGQLAHDLAVNSELKVVVLENDDDKIDEARRLLDSAGLYGKRVVVHKGSLTELPYTDYLFNLIVSAETVNGEKPPTDVDEVFRVLRPCGGVAMLGGGKYTELVANSWSQRGKRKENGWATLNNNGVWSFLKRTALPGAGTWSHQYGGPGNTSSSRDQLMSDVFNIQWFGRPGPGDMYNRHSRVPSPIYENGRLFIRAMQVLYGIDAYNGMILWRKELPKMPIRLNVHRDSSFMVADNDNFYVAINEKCRIFDGQTGKEKPALELPSGSGDWGYLGYRGDIFVGSAIRKGAIYTDNKSYYGSTVLGTEINKIISHQLFAYAKQEDNGFALSWKYEGRVINSSITIGDDKVFFVEPRHPDIVKSTEGKIENKELWEQTFLVALDLKTGKKIWEKKYNFETKVVFYLSYSDNVLLATGSLNEKAEPKIPKAKRKYQYNLYAFDSRSGKEIWNTSTRFRAKNDIHHGGYMQHPVIMGGKVYQDPYVYDLKTGKKGSLVLKRQGHGCGLLSGCENFMYGRGKNPRVYYLNKTGSQTLTSITRPGCAINMIPAGGLLLIPEGGSGCACPFSVQTSMAFIPLKK